MVGVTKKINTAALTERATAAAATETVTAAAATGIATASEVIVIDEEETYTLAEVQAMVILIF